MSVFLNSTPQEDGHILSGTVSVHGVASQSNVVSRREESQPAPTYLEISTGGQYVAILTKAGTYLSSGDTGFTFRWKFWAKGTGTVELRQDVDPAWAYSMPTPGIGNLVVSASDWTLYHVTADTISLSAFLAYDGVRLGMIGSSGTVQITTVQLECVPDDPAWGWWVNDTDVNEGDEYEATARARSALGTDDENSFVDRQEAWDAAVDEILGASNPILDPSPTLSFPDPISITGSSWYTGGEILFSIPTEYAAQFSLGIAKMWVDATIVGTQPVPHGSEGTDFIRVPGFTTADTYRLARSAANRTNPPTSFANWVTPNAIYSADNGSTTGDYEATQNAIGIWITEEETTSALPVSWSPVAGPNKIFTPDDVTTDVESISLPSSGKFVVYVLPMVLVDGVTYEPLLPDPGADVQIQMGAGVTLQSDAGAGFGAPLLYTVTFEAFSVWDPDGVPPGGKLKVRLPDATWRIVGDESGSATERLKMRTPDNTWWQEYRTVDGAVTTHPLKLYTADGWVVVANMTPD